MLLGDAVHTVKPYFGLGANSALEDVIALQRCLDDSPCDKPGPALEAFSSKRAGEARALVRLSRGLDRPGLLGFVSFVLPIILDGIFHKALPKVFAPNTIALLQRDGITFAQVAAKKRIDRALQVLLVGGLLATAARGACLAGSLALRYLLPASLTKSEVTTSAAKALGLLAAAAAAAAVKATLSRTEHMAPADAMAKQPKGGFADGGGNTKKGGVALANNADVLMKERLSQPGAGEPQGTAATTPPKVESQEWWFNES